MAASNGEFRWKTVAVVAIVAALGAAAFFTLRSHGVPPQEVAHWLKSVGGLWWAPLMFIALYALFNTFLLPATALTLTAGVVWGWLTGGLWVLAA